MTGIKSILCLFDGDERQLAALDFALAISVRHRAFVHVLHVTEPIDPYLELNSVQEADLITNQSHTADQIGLIVRARTARFGKDLWRGWLNSREFHETGVGYEALTGYVEKVVPRVARTSDIVVCARAGKEATPDAFMSTLLRSGRPVLLPPVGGDGRTAGDIFGKDVAIAWDRSVQATRAIHNLSPFLAADCRLHILSVAENHKKIDVRDDPAVTYWLRRHAFTPTLHFLDQGDKSVGDLLLAKAGEIGASVLAAGAYGHNAIFEKLVGGTTIDLYRRAKLPLFLTH